VTLQLFWNVTPCGSPAFRKNTAFISHKGTTHWFWKEKTPGKLGIVKPYFLFPKTPPTPPPTTVSRQAIHTRSQ